MPGGRPTAKMRFTPKKIEEILLAILGAESRPFIKGLIGKSNVSEFDLAAKTKMDIKMVRKMLYNLHNYNLVGFTRKKDKQKGWYIYYWTLLPESIQFNYYKMKRSLLDKLKTQLEEERKELFFVCRSKCLRLNFDQAMDFEFRCPECGELANQDEPQEQIKRMESKIKELEAEFAELKEQRKTQRKQSKERKKAVKARKNLHKGGKKKSSPKKETVFKKLRKMVKKRK